jgi:hypothetical protein
MQVSSRHPGAPTWPPLPGRPRPRRARMAAACLQQPLTCCDCLGCLARRGTGCKQGSGAAWGHRAAWGACAGVWGNLAGVAPSSALFMAVYEPVKQAVYRWGGG